ncbi:hypothetical protein A33M_2056 [Rhodovulum sp. PH10]|nr:hypothetical protein A33M_2056 [Rhodovulum sp. PH10]
MRTSLPRAPSPPSRFPSHTSRPARKRVLQRRHAEARSCPARAAARRRASVPPRSRRINHSKRFRPIPRIRGCAARPRQG